MTRVPVFTHPACVRHDPGPGHPETPARLQVVLARLAREPAAELRQAEPASPDALLAVHPLQHLQLMEQISQSGGGAVAIDTEASEESWEAVLAATGSASAALRHAHETGSHAFAAIRPPGHHALANRAMGFCLVNNVVVVARAAQALGRERVLIVDWDVHHGNGTQALVEQDARVRFVSLHQHPWYPGTGMSHERGVGNIFNVPRGPGAPATMYVEDLWAAIHAATDGWTPDIMLISAGYDAMKGDPLGGFTLEAEDYARLTLRLRERMPAAPIVCVLEGGYVPSRLADGVAATIGALT